MKLLKSRFLLMCIGIVILLSCQEPKAKQKISSESSPNVVILIADDVSWNDFGCYGNSFVQTPNIDYLAANGLKFNNAILTASSCSPSRISIMTGRYPHNTGAAELHTEPKVNFPSIASKLKNNGYYTGQAGKWHMGTLLRKGFDQIYDKLEQNGDGGEDKWIPSLKERDKNKPFFFWFAAYDAHRDWGLNKFANTHTPNQIEVPETLIDDDSTRFDLTKYYDEIKRFDFHVGEVINELKMQGVLNNTVIIVMADNGRPFPRDKTRMYDSGMKTPFIVHWPETIKKGIVSNSLISSLDIAPTILELCQVDVPESFQGSSFEQILEDPNTMVRDYAFSEHNWHDHEAHERMARTTDFIYILNSRPQFKNQGPADALVSSSFKSLYQKHIENALTAAQSDIFLAPRPVEELYFVKQDSMQLNNIIADEKFKSTYMELKSVLVKWMDNTGDNVPKNLTKDWYTRNTGIKIETNFEIRGEMPGQEHNADSLNSKDNP